jgi:hypothetical protein
MLEEDTTDETLKETLDSIVGEFECKADNIVGMIKALELRKGTLGGRRAVFEKEVDTIKKKEESIENNIGRLKKYLCDSMLAVGKPKFKTELYSFWTKETPGEVVIDGIVPMDYLTVPEPKPNKTAIKDAIKAGKEIDFAHIEKKMIAQFR